MPEQIPFDLPVRPALGREDFVVSRCNEMAVAVIDDTALWPNSKLVLSGAEGSGKTHLAHVWAHDMDASILEARALGRIPAAEQAAGPLVVEDLDAIAGDRTMETELFHLHNAMLSAGHPLLMTARVPPARLEFVLPDLRSRLEGTTLVTLESIDDTLLMMLLVKLFADRQLVVDPGVIDYVLPRIARSFRAVSAFVDELDSRALAQKRKPGIALAREILNRAGS